MRADRRLGARLVAAAFAVGGVAHLVRPRIFTGIVPRSLPSPRGVVYASGAAELACAAGLFSRARWAPLASAALLLAVWPANVRMALDVTGRAGEAERWKVAAVWARVPAQLLLVRAVLRERRPAPGRGREGTDL